MDKTHVARSNVHCVAGKVSEAWLCLFYPKDAKMLYSMWQKLHSCTRENFCCKGLGSVLKISLNSHAEK